MSYIKYQISNGSWCDCTIKKTETKLFEFLKNKYDLKIEPQKKFDWCKTKTIYLLIFILKILN